MSKLRQTRVYVAGPYSTGDPVLNTRTATHAATALLGRGYVPFLPHAQTMLWHLVDPQPYEVWMQYDFEWVLACDALLRVPGVSSGADREVRLAMEHNIEVYYSLDSLFARERIYR